LGRRIETIVLFCSLKKVFKNNRLKHRRMETNLNDVVGPGPVGPGPGPGPDPGPVNKVPTMAEAQARLLSTAITDENVALNVIVSFLNIAQRRGVFTMDESAKIWECIKIFQR